ncbi:MAG TPA: bifunctional riboflavin kinase/FAD synthetase [Rhodocyclaceae bacterium]|nr:bifunctional riboflavin kinase/FAD synthetase [Rhodocyclaceae bacterium]
MIVHRGIPHQATFASVLTIGNFDGVHLGHRAMLSRVVELARKSAMPAVVLTFEPHPREYFAPASAPARLTRLREKLELLAACGIDQVYVCRFNAKTAGLGADEFIDQVLVRGLGVRHLLIGDDFRFGKGRSGDFALLQEAGRAHRFTVEAMTTITLDDERVSSSSIRAALAAGNLARAEHFLGRPFFMSGRVMHGDKIGRTLGFPTANIQHARERLPLSGIYAVSVDGLDKQSMFGAASVGVRPTIADGLKPVLEVYLLDFNRDIYGEHVHVNFHHKLRDEAKFAGLDELKAQIARDVDATRDYFSHADWRQELDE